MNTDKSFLMYDGWVHVWSGLTLYDFMFVSCKKGERTIHIISHHFLQCPEASEIFFSYIQNNYSAVSMESNRYVPLKTAYVSSCICFTESWSSFQLSPITATKSSDVLFSNTWKCSKKQPQWHHYSLPCVIPYTVIALRYSVIMWYLASQVMFL